MWLELLGELLHMWLHTGSWSEEREQSLQTNCLFIAWGISNQVICCNGRLQRWGEMHNRTLIAHCLPPHNQSDLSLHTHTQKIFLHHLSLRHLVTDLVIITSLNQSFTNLNFVCLHNSHMFRESRVWRTEAELLQQTNKKKIHIGKGPLCGIYRPLL